MTKPKRERLDSWKEIADYLGRDTRTVERWEKSKGLPVHRVPGGRRNAVFAYPKEIDEWLLGQTGSELRAQPAWKQLSVRVGMGVLLLLAAAGLLLDKLAGAGPVRHAELRANQLVALNARGRVVWSHAFPETLEELAPERSGRLVQVVDLDADGSPEILAAPPLQLSSGGAEPESVLYCFSSKGELLWTYAAKFSVTYDGREYGGPWFIADMISVPRARETEVWISFTHRTWFPSFVMRLSAKGGSELMFIHPGWVTHLASLASGDRHFVLVAGINNSKGAGFVAVLDPAGPPATAPPFQGSPVCEACPAGRPARYYILTPSELSRVQALSYNVIRYVRIFEPGFEIRTIEATSPEGDNAMGVFEFGADFRLESASRTDIYWELHQQLERTGKITHSLANCPERRLPIFIQQWTRTSGWSLESGTRNAYEKPNIHSGP